MALRYLTENHETLDMIAVMGSGLKYAKRLKEGLAAIKPDMPVSIMEFYPVYRYFDGDLNEERTMKKFRSLKERHNYQGTFDDFCSKPEDRLVGARRDGAASLIVEDYRFTNATLTSVLDDLYQLIDLEPSYLMLNVDTIRSGPLHMWGHLERLHWEGFRRVTPEIVSRHNPTEDPSFIDGLIVE